MVSFGVDWIVWFVVVFGELGVFLYDYCFVCWVVMFGVEVVEFVDVCVGDVEIVVVYYCGVLKVFDW